MRDFICGHGFSQLHLMQFDDDLAADEIKKGVTLNLRQNSNFLSNYAWLSKAYIVKSHVYKN